MIYGVNSSLPEGVSEIQSAGMVGGGAQYLITEHTETSIAYISRSSSIGNQQHPEQKIWHDVYLRYAEGAINFFPIEPINLSDTSEDLIAALGRAIEFCKEAPNLEFWQSVFERALRTAQGVDAVQPDLSEKVLSENQRRIFAAACQAWVFGGMGSWNDLGFEGELQKRYESVSEKLYRAIKGSIIDSVNDASLARDMYLNAIKPKPSWFAKLFARP